MFCKKIHNKQRSNKKCKRWSRYDKPYMIENPWLIGETPAINLQVRMHGKRLHAVVHPNRCA
nr:MAG TPA: hypothetical protein [Caudoviricetes sp.]